MTRQEIKWLLMGVSLTLIAAFIGYLFAYFNIHLPFPQGTPTPQM